MPAPVVGIVGMAVLRRDLKRLTDDVTSPLYKAIVAAGKSAVEPVAASTRSRLPVSERRARGAGRLRGSVRTSGTRTGGAVRMGSKAIPWAPWVEFGGTRHAPHDSERYFQSEGRYLFPAARVLAHEAADLYGAAIGDVLAQAGVWTNSTSDGGRVHD